MSRGTYDLDLHGAVGIRLIDAPLERRTEIQKELAPIGTGLSRDPDLVIRFVDRIELGSPVRSIGLDDAEFTDDHFLVRAPGSAARASIPFHRLGEPCEVVCEHGLPKIPLLRSIVHLTALANGFAPAHASAVSMSGGGIVTTGWTSGGKTGALLTLMSLGARFISDDIVYIDGDGALGGLHEPMNIKDYYLADSPQMLARLKPAERLRLSSVRRLQGAAGMVPDSVATRLLPDGVRRRLSKWARRGRRVHVTPQRLFGAERCLASGRLKTVLFTQSADTDRVTVDPVDARETALRMASSSRHELSELDAYHHRFRFAFPGSGNPHIDGAEQAIADIFGRAMEDCDVFRISHPYPVTVPMLSEAIAPLVGPSGQHR
jgi:hypothetical protein